MLLSRTTRMLLGVAVLMLAGCGGDAAPPDAPPAEVGVVVLKAEPVTLTTDLPGSVSAFETSEDRPQVNGIIRRRSFTAVCYENGRASWRVRVWKYVQIWGGADTD